MSKIEDLIKQYCPNGCEWKRLGDLIRLNLVNVVIPSFKIKRNNYLNEGMVAIISQEAEYISGYWNVNDNRIVDDKYVCFGDHSEHLKYVDFPFVQGADGLKIMKCVTNALNTKYLYYSLCNEYVRQNDYARHFSKLRETSIPVPPLPVQEEIVRILDEYTELEVELEAKLSEEIELKQKQYEVYRDELLTFGDEVEYKKLKDVSSFANGKGHEKNIVNDGRYIVVNSKFVSTNGIVKKYSDVQICPLCIDDILMVMSDLPNGRALAKCYLVDENDKYTLNQRIGCFHTLNENIISTKFLFNVLNRNYQLLSYDNGIDQTNLRKNAILNIDIPVPPLQEQQCIVEILDKYDTYTRDMVSALNTELESRKKQYAYYRDQLLTFKRKE